MARPYNVWENDREYNSYNSWENNARIYNFADRLKMSKRKVYIGLGVIIFVVILIIALILGLVLGLRKHQSVLVIIALILGLVLGLRKNHKGPTATTSPQTLSGEYLTIAFNIGYYNLTLAKSRFKRDANPYYDGVSLYWVF
uniref:Uncharacterized protein n=1 Tax=Acrobeloides nanus TaxID=290746 RepID=A0A914EA18_9BILA